MDFTIRIILLIGLGDIHTDTTGRARIGELVSVGVGDTPILGITDTLIITVILITTDILTITEIPITIRITLMYLTTEEEETPIIHVLRLEAEPMKQTREMQVHTVATKTNDASIGTTCEPTA